MYLLTLLITLLGFTLHAGSFNDSLRRLQNTGLSHISEEKRDSVAIVLTAKKRVYVIGEDGKKRRAKIGERLYIKDRLETKRGAFVRLSFLDGSVFKFLGSTKFAINDYLYTNDQGLIDVKIEEGVGSYLSGKIATIDPDNILLKVPEGVIGIRGSYGEFQVRGHQSSIVGVGLRFTHNNGDKIDIDATYTYLVDQEGILKIASEGRPFLTELGEQGLRTEERDRLLGTRVADIREAHIDHLKTTSGDGSLEVLGPLPKNNRIRSYTEKKRAPDQNYPRGVLNELIW